MLALSAVLVQGAGKLGGTSLQAEETPTLSAIRAKYSSLQGGTWTEENVEQSFIHQVVRPGDTILEIGTNIGRSTIVAAESAGPSGRVVSAEADPRRRAVAAKNVEGLNNVELIPAISDTPLSLEVGNLGASTETDTAAKKTYQVSTTPLSAVRHLKPDVMIVDCEGCLDSLLPELGASAFLNSTRSIVLESDALDTVKQAKTHSQLTSLGFKRTVCVTDPRHAALLRSILLHKTGMQAPADDGCFWAVLQRNSIQGRPTVTVHTAILRSHSRSLRRGLKR